MPSAGVPIGIIAASPTSAGGGGQAEAGQAAIAAVSVVTANASVGAQASIAATSALTATRPTATVPAQASASAVSTVSANATAGFSVLTDITWDAAFWANDPGWSHPADGAAVSAWSGNGMDVAQATGTQQPIYRATVAALNNKSAVEFDGSDDMMVDATPVTRAQPFTVVAVVNAWSSYGTGDTARMIGSNNGQVQAGHGYPGTNDVTLYAGGADHRGTSPATVIDTTGSHFVLFYYNDASSAVAADSSAPVVVSATPGTIGIGGPDFTIGARSDGWRPSAMKLAFLAVYNGDLTANAKYSNFISWVQSYYGIGMPTDQGQASSSAVSTVSATALVAKSPQQVQAIGSNSAQAGGTTLSVTFTGATKPQAGDWIVIRVARDNITNDPATGDSITTTPGGETYTRVARAQPSGTSTSAAGIVGALFIGQVQTNWAAGTNTITWTSPSVIARAITVHHWRYSSGIRASSANSAGGTAGAVSVTTGVSLSAGDVCIAAYMFENGGTATTNIDTDTTNGSWSADVGRVDTGSSGNAATRLTFVSVGGQWKRVTAAGTQTYDASNTTTTSVDAVGIVSALTPAAAA